MKAICTYPSKKKIAEKLKKNYYPIKGILTTLKVLTARVIVLE